MIRQPSVSDTRGWGAIGDFKTLLLSGHFLLWVSVTLHIWALNQRSEKDEENAMLSRLLSVCTRSRQLAPNNSTRRSIIQLSVGRHNFVTCGMIPKVTLRNKPTVISGALSPTLFQLSADHTSMTLTRRRWFITQ